MADKQLGIVVTGDIDDISSKLDSLASQIESLESKAIELTIEANTAGLQEVSSASEAASVELNEASDAAESLSYTMTNMATGETISYVSSEVNNLNDGLESASGAAGETADNLGGIGSQALNEAASHANSLGDNIKATSNSAKEMGNEINNASSNAITGLQALAGVAATVGSYLVLDNLISSAGAYEDSWSRMTVALGGTVDTIGMVKDDWSSAISDMSSATGRGAGTIREFITQMSLAGVESKDVISSAFEGIAGAAYVTGIDINTITYALQRATRTGLLNQRTLTSLGLSTNDIMKATGKSIEQVSDEFEKMTPTARAAFLGMIYNAKYGTDANEAYKQSWEHVNDALNRAWGYLSIVFGQLILPIAIPAIEALTEALNGLSKWIAALDPTSRGLLGWLVILTGAFVTLMGIVASGLAVWNALKISQALATVATWLNTDATITNTAIKEQSALANLKLIASEIRARAASIASTIAESARGAASTAAAAAQHLLNTSIISGAIATGRDVIAKVAHAAASAAQAVATGLATAAQWLLNAAMAASPIGLVVIAVAALVAGLYLLYQNNEQVRNSINGLWASLQGLGGYIQSGFYATLEIIKKPFTDLINNIKNLGTDLYDTGKNWIVNLGEGIKASIPDLNGALEEIGKYLPHSPAEVGPLSEVTPDSMSNYGNQLGTGLADGMSTGFSKTITQPGAWDVLKYIGNPLSLVSQVSSEKETIDKVTKSVENMAAATNAAANMTVEDAQKAGMSLADWATGYQQFGSTARLTYDSLANRGTIASQVQQQALADLKQKAIETYNSIKQAAQDAYSTVAGELGLGGITLPSGVIASDKADAIKKLYEARDALLRNSNNMTLSEFQHEFYTIDAQLKQLTSSGQSIGAAWGNGIASGIQSTQSNINNAIANASRGLIAYSPPKEGPLSKIDEYGMSIGQTFTEYLSKGLGTAGNLFDFNTLPTPSASMVSGSSSGGGYNFYFGDVHVPEGSDPVEVGRGLAKGAHESFSERISDQAARRGTVIPNILR